MRGLPRRLWQWLRWRKWEAEIAEEMAFHRAMKERELSGERGITNAVRAEAGRAMGNITFMREQARDALLPRWVASILNDARYGFRSLVTHSGFVLLALPLLAVGLGVNVSFFSVFSAVALRPWPVREPERLVALKQAFPQRDREGYFGFPLAAVSYIRDHSRSFEGLVAVRNGLEILGDDLPDDRTRFQYVSGKFFDLLGVRMAHGRGFLSEEDNPDRPLAVAVLSHAIWRLRFGSDPDIVGRTIRVNQIATVVVGVASEEFQGVEPGPAAVYMPMASLQVVRAQDEWVQQFLRDPRRCCAELFARLRPGVRRESAHAETDLLVSAFRAANKLDPIPSWRRPSMLLGTRALDDPKARREATPLLALMFLGFTLVLTLVCVTVGNLFLAKAGVRQREIAVRLSLGASRGRVVRQLLIENLLLALLAAAGAIGISLWLPGWALHHLTSGESSGLYLWPDWRVMGYAIGLSTLACLLFGLGPALAGTRVSLPAAATHRAADFTGRVGFRSFLSAVQVALSVVLLSGGALTLRGIYTTSERDLGFELCGLSVVHIALPASAQSAGHRSALARELRVRLPDLPAGKRWAQAQYPPLGGASGYSTVSLPGWSGKQHRGATRLAVSPNYFRVLGIPLLSGRGFTTSDESRHVAVVNQSMARTFWPDQNPAGREFVSDSRTMAVIGVVADAELLSVGATFPTFFEPIGNTWAPAILVRSSDEAFESRVKAMVEEIEPGAHVGVFPLEENLDRQLAPLRAGAKIAGTLGGFALTLAAAGMVGVFGYFVQWRTKEIGVRMALGATASQVVRLVAWTGGKAVAAGAIAGLAAAVAVGRLLEGKLYGLSSLDPLSYASVLAVLALACAVAGAIPLRRAASVHPVEALRHE